jgi:hypothetical protein
MILKENQAYPYEGFFWIINDEVVGILSEVPYYNYEYVINGKEHANTWRNFSKDYLVDGKEVQFDYFPRGRIMVDPNYDMDGKFDYYSCMVFLDKCINNAHCKELIKDYYNLDLPSMPYITWTMLGERAGIDHYTCNQCRG